MPGRASRRSGGRTGGAARGGRLPASPAFLIAIVFLGVVTLFGGSSRADSLSLLALRPLVVALLLATLALTRPRWRELAPLLWLLGAWALAMAVQLVPLPPELWRALPGHDRFVAVDALAGIDPPWRPISLTPDLTLNALLALLPALTSILLYAALSPEERRRLVLVPIAVAVISAVLGVLQVATGAASPLYLYRPTSDTLPVGLFANRNHQAAVLAAAIPAAATWAMLSGTRLSAAVRGRAAIVIVLLLIPVVLVTGSRTGSALAALALGIAFAITWRSPALANRPWRKPALALGAVLVVAAAGVTILAGRAASLDRLLGTDADQVDMRVRALPTLLTITRDFLPTGTGFGAFDTVFRAYEPEALLKPTYFNRAHNDLIEAVLTGGVPALLVMLGFLCWYATRCWRLALRPGLSGDARAIGVLGAAIVAILVGASIVDYPLRGSLASVVFALGCCFMTTGAGRSPNGERTA